ncbi:MAG: DUF3098 domain-containing protein [Haliscomenobacter sp.]
MSKQQSPKQKVVVQPKGGSGRTQSSRAQVAEKPVEFLFGKQNYLLLAVATVLMILGIALMSGGKMPDPNTWDDNLIYSSRRTVLAPAVMIASLIVGVFAIFRK